MPVYETVYILRPDLAPPQVKEINQNYINLISQELEDKATIGREEYWGLRNIAFRMRKQRKGHYLLINYESTSVVVNEFERKMRLSEDVMRYMTIRLEKMPTEPSIMMRRIDENDDGPRSRYNKRPHKPRSDAPESDKKPIEINTEAVTATPVQETE